MSLSPWSCSSLSLTHTGTELFSFAYWKTKEIKITERARKITSEDAELFQVGAQVRDPQIRSGTRTITLLAPQSFLISSEAAMATCEHSQDWTFWHSLIGWWGGGHFQTLTRVSSIQSLVHSPTSCIQFCPRCTWTWDTCIHKVYMKE